MKFNRKILLAALITLAFSVVLFTGCNGKNNKAKEETSTSSGDVTSVPEGEEFTDIGTTRALEEGDVYAIHKIFGTLPEGYSLIAENDFGRAYANGMAKFEVGANNYKEDYTDLATYADSSCASIRFNNMLYTSDTEFETPVNTTVAGFDAISYDYTIIVNEFIKENPEDEGDGVKTEVGRHKARAYFFYSDKDIYYIIFQTSSDNWDSLLPGFEDYIASVNIDESVTPEDVASNNNSAS